MAVYPVSEETRKRQSEAAKVAWSNPDIRAKRLDGMARKPRTEAVKDAIRQGHLKRWEGIPRTRPWNEPGNRKDVPKATKWRVVNGIWVDCWDEKNILDSASA